MKHKHNQADVIQEYLCNTIIFKKAYNFAYLPCPSRNRSNTNANLNITALPEERITVGVDFILKKCFN